MKQLLDLYQLILDTGIQQPNRTGVDTLTIPGAMMRYDLREGFPACTTKQLYFKAVKGELVGFLRGYTNAKQFRDLGCNIWNQNANENKDWLNNPYRKGEDDLGEIYGHQWSNWDRCPSYNNLHEQWSDPTPINQVQEVIKKLYDNPTDRRMIISAWNPAKFDRMALLPCHVLYQFIADTKNNVLHLCMYQRSCDMFLGVPFNIASASLFLSIVAKMTGYTAGIFTHFLADAHIYVNHLEQVNEQLSRSPYTPPSLKLNIPVYDTTPDVDWVYKIMPEDFELVDYKHHPAIKAQMAV